MYVAASSRCFADQPFEKACQTLTDLGYDHLELWVDSEGGHLTLERLAGSPEEFVAAYRDATRMTPVTLTLAKAPTAESFEKLTKTAKLLRVGTVVVPAGEQGTPFNEEIDRLRELTRLAGVDGVRLAVRTQAGRMADDPQSAAELCRHVPGLGLSLDAGELVAAGTPPDAWDPMYEKTFHVQLRDTNKGESQVPLGLGDVDYARIASQLEKVDYRQALSVELLPGGIEGDDRLLEMRKTRRLLDTLL